MPLSILMIASEAVPFAKTGGLGDVAGALPLALGRLGHRVTLVLPRYRGVTAGAKVGDQTIDLGGQPEHVVYFEQALSDRARAVLVECPLLFDRDGVYGSENVDYPDNPRRFALLVRAALEFTAREEKRPSLVHAHDWQAGLAPVYLKTRYATHPVLGGLPTVFTIHNVAYQGIFPITWAPALDLGSDLLTTEALEYWGSLSFLKGGVNFSNAITTVAPAKTIARPAVFMASSTADEPNQRRVVRSPNAGRPACIHLSTALPRRMFQIMPPPNQPITTATTAISQGWN